MVEFSIIITYYQTLDLMKTLMEKLIPQLTEEVQVVIVDDGCKEVALDEYKDKADVIHLEENLGNASAMNVGIKNSVGEYIGYVDSDDMVSNDYVSVLLKAIKETNAEVITMDWEDMANGVVIRRPGNYAPWRSIYRKDIMPMFIDGMRHSADVPFKDKLYSVKRDEYYVDRTLYYYNSNRVGNLTWYRNKIISGEIEGTLD